jgi:VWFA-related protein
MTSDGSKPFVEIITQRCVVVVALLLCPFAAAAQRPFIERVDVSRVLVDARVLDDAGRALPGLAPSDFKVTIDGDPVQVESAEWIEGGEGAPVESALPASEESRSRQSSGRLIVVLVQKDLEPKRAVGLMIMLQLIEPLLQRLTPADRVAVLSFDSRLRIWTDFTADVDRVRALLKEDLLLRGVPAVTVADGPSLLARLDLSSRRRSGDFERSLQMIGEALQPLPGAKSVVLLGYGFGRFNPSTLGATMMPAYGEARAALQSARASVFSLNVTQANFNSLQAGLQAVSAATGGFYTSTYEFPMLAMDRVVRAIEGYYVLFVEKPKTKAGEHRIEVELVGRQGTVFARSGYVD